MFSLVIVSNTAETATIGSDSIQFISFVVHCQQWAVGNAVSFYVVRGCISHFVQDVGMFGLVFSFEITKPQ
jgi:hypothetical protein